MSLINKFSVLCGWFFAAAAFAAPSEVGNSIEAINVARQGDDIAIKIDLKNELLSIPASFSVTNPPKIAFDFPGVSNGLGKNAQVLNEGDLRSFNIVQVSDRTRLVVNLSKKMSYDTRLEGYRDWETDRKSTRLNSSHSGESRMPSSA